MNAENAEDMAAKSQTLAQSSMKLGEAMYKAQEAGGGSDDGMEGTASKPGEPNGPGDAPGPDNIVDAEFEEVEEEEKRNKSA